MQSKRFQCKAKVYLSDKTVVLHVEAELTQLVAPQRELLQGQGQGQG